MKVEIIGAFYNTFDLHLTIIGLENQFSIFFGIAVLQRFYCMSELTWAWPPIWYIYFGVVCSEMANKDSWDHSHMFYCFLSVQN